MSAAIVKKALELSEDTPGPLEKKVKSSAKRKLKALEKSKKKNLSPEKLVKRNLKILKALQFASKNKKKYGKAPSEIPGPSSSSTAASSSKKKNKKEEKSAFTEEDFEKKLTIRIMNPKLKLTLCGVFLFGLAIVLFGAPFLPSLRPYAWPLLLCLIGVGNLFCFVVLGITLYIAYTNKTWDNQYVHISKHHREVEESKNCDSNNDSESKKKK